MCACVRESVCQGGDVGCDTNMVHLFEHLSRLCVCVCVFVCVWVCVGVREREGVRERQRERARECMCQGSDVVCDTDLVHLFDHLSRLRVCVRVFVCMCVCEREREREVVRV